MYIGNILFCHKLILQCWTAAWLSSPQSWKDRARIKICTFYFSPFLINESKKTCSVWNLRTNSLKRTPSKSPSDRPYLSRVLDSFNEHTVSVSLLHSCPVAQKVVAMRKKQQLSIGPCKSLPNSPSHSSVPAASIPSVHINQVGSKPSKKAHCFA